MLRQRSSSMNTDQSDVKHTADSSDEKTPPPRPSRPQPPQHQPTPGFIKALYVILLSTGVFLILQKYAYEGVFGWRPFASATTVFDTGYAQYRGDHSAPNTKRLLGIPYAEPPVGDRRFRAPLPLNKTRVSQEAQGVVVDATEYPDFCVQGMTAGKIYCLILWDSTGLPSIRCSWGSRE